MYVIVFTRLCYGVLKLFCGAVVFLIDRIALCLPLRVKLVIYTRYVQQHVCLHTGMGHRLDAVVD